MEHLIYIETLECIARGSENEFELYYSIYLLVDHYLKRVVQFLEMGTYVWFCQELGEVSTLREGIYVKALSLESNVVEELRKVEISMI